MKRTRIRPVSAKRRKTWAHRSLTVDICLLRDGHCKGLDLIPDHICRGPKVGHEILKRSAGGSELDKENVFIVCAQLNQDIEDWPLLARAFGLSVSMGRRYENGRLIL